MREMQRKGDAQDISPKNEVQIIVKSERVQKPAPPPPLWEYEFVMRS
jgi:hypothetical protein